jgi:ketosteroid isomerase-like protein
MQANAEIEAAVRAVLDRLADVYVTRDAAVLVSVFASDPDVTMHSPGAERVVGIEDIQAKAASDWTRTDTASLAYGRTSVSAAGSVAWVATDADFTVSAGSQETITPVRITFVLEQRSGEWRIVHAHYSVAAAVTSAEGGTPTTRHDL